jgi:peptidyl-prolyl cis-trans isomerase B (cyclophilin B)
VFHVSPSKREREYARRRYSDWQQRQAEKKARRRRIQIILAVIAAVTVPALVFGFMWWQDRDKDPVTAEPGSSPTETADPESPCPPVDVSPPAEPLQFKAAPDKAVAEGRTWTATIATTCGDIALELSGALAPQAVANFVQLSKDSFFNSTPCHRLTTEGIFVLQCGDPTGTGNGGPGYSWGPIENAPADDKYPAGTLAMARVGNDAASQGSQFFLVYEDSTIPSDTAGGYTVFGKITAGLDIIQKIADGGLAEDQTAPKVAVSIKEVTVS